MKESKNAVRRIGVLTSGGDAPGMNAAVRAVVRAAIFRGIEVIGIRRGYNGLINGDIVRLDEKSVAHIINRGGTMLYTARSMEFMTEEGQQKAVNTCKMLGLDGIVAIGGDGTFRGAQALSHLGKPGPESSQSIRQQTSQRKLHCHVWHKQGLFQVLHPAPPCGLQAACRLHPCVNLPALLSHQICLPLSARLSPSNCHHRQIPGYISNSLLHFLY